MTLIYLLHITLRCMMYQVTGNWISGKKKIKIFYQEYFRAFPWFRLYLVIDFSERKFCSSLWFGLIIMNIFITDKQAFLRLKNPRIWVLCRDYFSWLHINRRDGSMHRLWIWFHTYVSFSVWIYLFWFRSAVAFQWIYIRRGLSDLSACGSASIRSRRQDRNRSRRSCCL